MQAEAPRGGASEHPGIGDEPGRVDEARLGRHVLVAVGDPEAEIEQWPKGRARALDRGHDLAALTGPPDRGEGYRHRIHARVRMDDEAVEDAERAVLPDPGAPDLTALAGIED